MSLRGQEKLMKRRKKINFNSIVKNKKLPILTLDSRWHELFPDEKKTHRIRDLEQKLIKLLKTQGKLVNEIKDMKNLKKSLMSEIVANMDIENDSKSKSKEKKLDRNKNYINELNKKMDNASNRLADLPYEIKRVNEELLVESIKNGYDRIHDNQEDLSKISDWIIKTREELKRKIVLKNDMETTNKQMYSYLHDVLGPEIIEAIDKTQEKK